jgi:RnfABCDGE-type electron transport complex D subunit
MRKTQKLLHKVADLKIFSPFKAVFETIDGIIYGTPHVTPGAPHFVDHIEIKRFMIFAVIALFPTAIAAGYFFGIHVLWMIIVSYVVGGVVEVTFALIRKREIEEGFLVTGLIFPLILPPTLPLWAVAIGAFFGVFFGKEIFGGTGRNIFNPALVGRLFITMAFPEIMSSRWQVPLTDAITSATPLTLYNSGGTLTAVNELLFGVGLQTGAGSMGEVLRIGIIPGGNFLILTKVTDWKIPTFYILTVAVFSWILNMVTPQVAPPVFQLLSGGLLFGAFFMATDPVTTPYTRMGKVIFGIMCGVLTVLIRGFAGYAEGVMFSIILMNGMTPLIDHMVMQHKYRKSLI